MLNSPILSHLIQTQTKFKAPLFLSVSDQDPWPPQNPSLFKSRPKTHGFLKAPLFRSRPNHHLHGHGFQISSFLISISLLSLDRSKPSATVVWCLDLKTINQTQKGPTTVRGCGSQQWRIKAWGASAWVPHGETKVEDQMVVIGLKIGEGLKLVDVDVVGLKILDHWFEFSFGSLVWV